MAFKKKKRLFKRGLSSKRKRRPFRRRPSSGNSIFSSRKQRLVVVGVAGAMALAGLTKHGIDRVHSSRAEREYRNFIKQQLSGYGPAFEKSVAAGKLSDKERWKSVFGFYGLDFDNPSNKRKILVLDNISKFGGCSPERLIAIIRQETWNIPWILKLKQLVKEIDSDLERLNKLKSLSLNKKGKAKLAEIQSEIEERHETKNYVESKIKIAETIFAFKFSSEENAALVDEAIDFVKVSSKKH